MNTIEQAKTKILSTISTDASKLLLLLATATLCSLIMSSLVWDFEKPVIYHHGEVAKQTVRAPYDLVLQDTYATEMRREEALSNSPRVFTLHATHLTDPSQHLGFIFTLLRELGGAVDHNGLIPINQEKRMEFERRTGLNLVGEEWTIVADPMKWPKLESAVVELSKPILSKGIIAHKQSLRSALLSGRSVLRDKGTGKEEQILSPASIFDPNEALTEAEINFPRDGIGEGAAFDSLAHKLLADVLQPNVIFDSEETDRRIRQAENDVDASVIKIQRGQVMVRAGDVVSAAEQRMLEQFEEQRNQTTLIRVVIGYLMLTCTVLCAVYFFCVLSWPRFTSKVRDLELVAITLCGSCLMLKIFLVLATSLSYSFSHLDSNAFMIAAPIAAGGILLQTMIGAPAVFMFVMSFALITGIFLNDSWLMLMLLVIGNFTGAIGIRACSRRSSFIYAGIRIAGVNALVMLAYLLFYPQLTPAESATRLLLAVAGGFCSGVLAGGLAPFAEYLGGYITDIKLLELASLDRPLLRDLSLQAPGTWNHSMLMGQIAEAAAEAIGADSLLVRVGAYYHDIGKIKKPAYFVENQAGRENRHDKLTPSMSALIIKAHVKDGIELALEHRVPRMLVDFIPQHHGNSLIEYFYEKALREAEEGEVVDEGHYRYPGPRPQTKEAGILMLADAVEASSRTLSDPQPAKIQGLVQKIINKVFASGELNECELTLQDLHQIAKSFTRVLTGIYHRRIEYSEPAEKVRDMRYVKQRAEHHPEIAETPLQTADALQVTVESEKPIGGQDTVSPSQERPEELLKRLGMQKAVH